MTTEPTTPPVRPDSTPVSASVAVTKTPTTVAIAGGFLVPLALILAVEALFRVTPDPVQQAAIVTLVGYLANIIIHLIPASDAAIIEQTVHNG